MAVSDTLRGYRTQFLYTLHRIVTEKDSSIVYRPEGIEDLDIIKQGNYIETIQVKNYRSGSVSLSNLSSKGNKTSFFSRGIDILKQSSNAKLKLVSYGNVDRSLSDKNRLLQSLNKQFGKEIAKSLVQHFDIEIVDEDLLYRELNTSIKVAFVNANPEKEITYLVQWISERAELHEEITYDDFVRQLTCYEAFLIRQACCADELGSRIKPLFMEPVDNLNKNLLEKEFYQGVSVSDKHIWAGLGVRRTDKEQIIEEYFQDSSVVIVHGMSGQGKSYLCYQFIKKNYPIAFEITNCDKYSFCKVCASIEEMVAGLYVPILLYMDVVPSNSEWFSLVNSFASYKYVRLLVSIREDDWHQHQAKLNMQVSFKDIHLELTKNEAEKIFNVLDVSGSIRSDAKFNDVWSLFSDSGALLEFVYYLTHGQKLKDRIITQWNDLSGEDKQVVSYITIANYLGGRIKREDLLALNDIKGYLLVGQIQRLTGEFFCCESNGIIKDLHPLRTKLLKEAIFEDATEIFQNEALKLYATCDVEDPYLYVIRLMNEGVQVGDFLRYIRQVKRLSCSQLFGIVKGLIWKGAESFEKTNHALISQLRQMFGPAWNLFLPINFTEVDLESSIEKLSEHIPNFNSAKEIINRFTQQEDVYFYIRQYLENSSLTVYPISWKDWWYASQIAYWTNCANLASHISYYGEINVISNDIDEMATVLLGFKINGINVPGLKNVEKEFVEHLREQFFIVGWSCADSIEAIVFTNYFKVDDKTKNGIKPNDYLVRLIELCRRAFPEKKLYCAKFGGDLILESIDIPDVEKRIDRANLPLLEMHEIRSVIVNLFARSYQQSSRESYAYEVFDKRKKCVAQVSKLCNSYESYWLKGNKGLIELGKEYDAFNLIGSTEIEKPKSSHNIWGYGEMSKCFGGFGKGKYESDGDDKDSLDKYHYIMKQHFSSLVNFINQSIDVLIGKERASVTNYILIDLLEKLPKFQFSYKELFSNYVDDSELSALEKHERKIYLLLWLIWDTQLKNICVHKSIKGIMNRYEQMQSNLVNVVSTKIVEKIEKVNFVCRVNLEGKNLNVEIDYMSEQEYMQLQIVALYAIIEVLGKYGYFSTQRLILDEVFDTIVVKPYYKSLDGKRYFLEDKLVSYNFLACLEKDVQKDEDMPTPFPVFQQNKILNQYLNSYIGFRNFIGSGHFFSNQIKIMLDSTDEEDEYGQKLIKSYLLECRKKLLSLAFIDDWPSIKSWFVNTKYESDINNAFNIANRFYNEIQKTDRWYNMDDILNQTSQQLQNHDLGIKIFLVERN